MTAQPSTRRGVGLLYPLLAAAMLVAACAPAAGTPASGTNAPSAAQTERPASAAGATTTTPAAWETEWERTLAAAREEGVIALSQQPGGNFREWISHFERKYPGIRIELSGMTGSEASARILAERRGDQFLRDVHQGGAESLNGTLKPAGALDPFRPALILPEVLDDSKWLKGFDDGFADVEGMYTYAFSTELVPTVYVNRDFVPESELSRVEDLLDPKWRGRMTFYDPRQSGKGSSDAAHYVQLKGEDWFRQLLAQEPVITFDRRQQIEWAVRGRYPIGLSLSNTVLPEFQEQGAGLHIVPLAYKTPLGARISMSKTIAIINRAPHPNAAKVFVNWVLSREGQQLFSQLIEENSRRLDVDGIPATKPDPAVDYPPSNNKEAYSHFQRRAMDIAKEVIKQ
jgi:iron(III) transport system substrate-binding protein